MSVWIVLRKANLKDSIKKTVLLAVALSLMLRARGGAIRVNCGHVPSSFPNRFSNSYELKQEVPGAVVRELY